MATFSNRFGSRQELAYIFAVCIIPVHVWLIINVLREVPAWILRLTTWDLVGVLAYSLVFALVESTLVFLGVLLLGIIIPVRFIRGKAIALSTVLLFLTSTWFGFLHYNNQIIERRQVIPFVLWGISYVLVLLIAYFLIQRKQKLEALLNDFVKRLAVLSFIYFLMDIVSIVIIGIRNLL